MVLAVAREGCLDEAVSRTLSLDGAFIFKEDLAKIDGFSGFFYRFRCQIQNL